MATRTRIRTEVKAAALQEIDRQLQAGELVIRQATRAERERFGIDDFQERRRRELEEQPARRRRAPAADAPPDPTLVEGLRDVRAAELNAPQKMNQLLVSVVDARAVTIVRIAEITGISKSSVADRIRRTRCAGVSEPVELVDPEARLREARARELSAPGESNQVMIAAADRGMTRSEIAAAVGLSDNQVCCRIAATRRERSVSSHTPESRAAAENSIPQTAAAFGHQASGLPGTDRPDS